MNIFQYFEASGSRIYTDFDHRVTFFHRDGGCEIVPWDKSYKRWISYSLLNFVPKRPEIIVLEVPRNVGISGIIKKSHQENGITVIDKFDLKSVSVLGRG